jgi:hypothetical protein
MNKGPILSTVFLLIVVVFSATCDTSATSDRQPIHEALQWIRTAPQGIVQYDYIMTARVRLLFFWAGKDDVGGGYIRRGVSSENPREEFFQVLFGSDPAKAPRGINRWGAGTEVSQHQEPVTPTAKQDDVTASAFFGFMKSSRGKSVAEMQDTDYTLHQYDVAQPLMLEKISSSVRPLRTLQEQQRCPRAKEFLATVAELMDAALEGQPAPSSRCYVYDAQENNLTLENVWPLATLPVQLHGPNNVTLLDSSYSHLLQLDFVSTHKLTGKKVYFSIIEGTEGKWRGVPVQIRYQPNWWFQVVLNLRPSVGTATSVNARTN